MVVLALAHPNIYPSVFLVQGHLILPAPLRLPAWILYSTWILQIFQHWQPIKRKEKPSSSASSEANSPRFPSWASCWPFSFQAKTYQSPLNKHVQPTGVSPVPLCGSEPAVGSHREVDFGSRKNFIYRAVKTRRSSLGEVGSSQCRRCVSRCWEIAQQGFLRSVDRGPFRRWDVTCGLQGNCWVPPSEGLVLGRPRWPCSI